MARTYRPKPFDPKPLTPGARVEWEHSTYDEATGRYSRAVRRTGTVWSKAPLMDGRDAVWVTPDEARPGDLYSALIVTTDRKRTKSGPEPRLTSSDDNINSTPGYWTAYAARHAASVRRGRDFIALTGAA